MSKMKKKCLVKPTVTLHVHLTFLCTCYLRSDFLEMHWSTTRRVNHKLIMISGFAPLELDISLASKYLRRSKKSIQMSVKDFIHFIVRINVS